MLPMEDNSSHNSVSDSTNEPESLESGEMKEKSEESYKNIDGETNEVTRGSENIVEKETKVDRNEEKKATQDYDESCALVVDTSSAGDADTCPVPPIRQRRKSRAGSDSVTAEEKAHGGTGESESQGKEEKREEGGKEKESTLANNISEEKAETSTECQEKEVREACDEGTNTNTEEIKPIPTRRHKKGEGKPKKETEPKPPPDEINLEEGINMKEDKKEALEDDEKKSLVGLKKELGLLNCVGIIVGNIIGTGIFISPGAVLQYTGSVGVSIIVWIVTGLVAFVGAFCYAELGAFRHL